MNISENPISLYALFLENSVVYVQNAYFSEREKSGKFMA